MMTEISQILDIDNIFKILKYEHRAMLWMSNRPPLTVPCFRTGLAMLPTRPPQHCPVLPPGPAVGLSSMPCCQTGLLSSVPCCLPVSLQASASPAAQHVAPSHMSRPAPQEPPPRRRSAARLRPSQGSLRLWTLEGGEGKGSDIPGCVCNCSGRGPRL
jgi:hypothetical protein